MSTIQTYSIVGALLWAALVSVGCSGNPGGPNPLADSGDPATDLQTDRSAVYEARPDITIGPPVTLTVATFNVHDFFDESDDPMHEDTVLSSTTVKEKIKELGRALRELKADVLALQEVENKALLDRLNTEELSSLSYNHVRLVSGNDMRGMNLALLSRYPIPRAVSHVTDSFPGVDGDTVRHGFSRDCLEATVEPSAGRTLVLLINHLRADNSAESVKKRQAQAAQIRRIADSVLQWKPEANLAVIGDLNDVPTSRTLQLISAGTPALEDLTALVPTENRYSYIYEGKKQQIDFIIAAPGLRKDLLDGSVSVNHATMFRDTSDHYPVSARFNLQ